MGAERVSTPQDARPSDTLAPGGISPWPLLFSLLRSVRRQLGGAILTGGLVSASPIIGLRLVEESSRTLVGNPAAYPLDQLAWASLGLALLLGALAYGQHILTSHAGLQMASRLRNQALELILALPWSWLQRQRIGELTTRLGHDVLQIQYGVERLFPRILRLMILPLGVVGYLLYLSPFLTLITLCWVLLGGGAMAFLGRSARRHARQSAAGYDDLNAVLQESLHNRYTLKCLGSEDWESARFRRYDGDFLRSQQARTRIDAIYRPATALLQLVCILGLLLFGGHLVQSGELDVSQFTAYLAGLGTLLGNFSTLGGLQGEAQQTIVALERMAQLLDLKPTDQEVGAELEIPTGQGRIRFEGVSFSHEQANGLVLDDIDLTIPPGEMLAIVGPSGAGKTTLLNLLLRLYPPSRGRILVKGLDIALVNRRSLYTHIGMVPQQPELFAGTVHENIAYARPGARREQVIQAALMARADEFIQRLPKGYDTRLDESGGNLSAGERQRLAIARALLREPAVLLLDEPTANLDPHSERLITEALRRLRGQCTILVVAHRLSTARCADRVLVLESGRVSEIGPPDELLQLEGRYRRLFQATSEAA